LGLLAGTFVMIAKKGDTWHKQAGKIFAYSMLLSGFCSLILASLHRNDFLFAVGVFTIYLTGTGWRYLYLKNIPKGQNPMLIDWCLVGFMLIFGAVFIILGILSLIKGNSFGIIPILFASIGLRMTWADWQTFNGKIIAPNYWLLFHLQRMVGAYIASLTAFLVVNAPNSLSIFPWLLPTFVLVPFIVKWSREQKAKNRNLIK
jgi:hypothetical protein